MRDGVVQDILGVLGVALLIAGFTAFSWRVGLIVAGICSLIIATQWARTEPPAPPKAGG